MLRRNPQDTEVIVKTGAQEPHPVWGFKNLKRGRCGGGLHLGLHGKGTSSEHCMHGCFPNGPTQRPAPPPPAPGPRSNIKLDSDVSESDKIGFQLKICPGPLSGTSKHLGSLPGPKALSGIAYKSRGSERQ